MKSGFDWELALFLGLVVVLPALWGIHAANLIPPQPEPVCTQWAEQDVHIIECKARDSGRCTQWTDERIERRTVCVK